MQIAKQQIKYLMDGVGAISPEQRAVDWEKMFSPAHFSARCSTVFWYISGKPIYTHWYKHKPLSLWLQRWRRVALSPDFSTSGIYSL